MTNEAYCLLRRVKLENRLVLVVGRRVALAETIRSRDPYRQIPTASRLVVVIIDVPGETTLVQAGRHRILASQLARAAGTIEVQLQEGN